jgi:hypothetical protein
MLASYETFNLEEDELLPVLVLQGLQFLGSGAFPNLP